MYKEIPMSQMAYEINAILEKHFPAEQSRERQVIALAEEVGEFCGAARRYMGMARRTGSFKELAEELADVIITAYVTAEVFGIEIGTVLDDKMAVIFARGWKDAR